MVATQVYLSTHGCAEEVGTVIVIRGRVPVVDIKYADNSNVFNAGFFGYFSDYTVAPNFFGVQLATGQLPTAVRELEE